MKQGLKKGTTNKNPEAFLPFRTPGELNGYFIRATNDENFCFLRKF
jgi:hypothetical protein